MKEISKSGESLDVFHTKNSNAPNSRPKKFCLPAVPRDAELIHIVVTAGLTYTPLPRMILNQGFESSRFGLYQR